MSEPARNERTSKRVAAIAGRILAVKFAKGGMEVADTCFYDRKDNLHTFKWRDIRALAASALTQAANKERSK